MSRTLTCASSKRDTPMETEEANSCAVNVDSDTSREFTIPERGATMINNTSEYERERSNANNIASKLQLLEQNPIVDQTFSPYEVCTVV